MSIKVNFRKLNEKAVAPMRASAQAAGCDLYACIDKDEWVTCSKTVKIPTGIAVEIPEGYAGFIFARSGLATKEGLRPANCVGVVDSDYRGEVIVAIHNDSVGDKRIKPGERIAQMVIMPYLPVEYVEADELSDTDRGVGGFGSTGK